MSLDLVSNGDPTKWDKITNTWTAVKFLNVLSYLKDKGDLMEEMRNNGS